MVKCRELNFRMVRVIPWTLQGGMTYPAAVRKPGIENGFRLRNVVSKPSRDILYSDQQGFLGERDP